MPLDWKWLALNVAECCSNAVQLPHAGQNPAVRAYRRLEDTLDLRTSELIALRKAAVEHSAASPVKSAQLALALGAWATGAAPGCRPSFHAGHGSHTV